MAEENEMLGDLIRGGMTEDEAEKVLKELDDNMFLGVEDSIVNIGDGIYITSVNNSHWYKETYGFNFVKMGVSNI